MTIKVFPVRARPDAQEERAPGRSRPCPTRVSYVDTHDAKRGSHKHEAQDIFAPTGSVVLAPESSRVLGWGETPKGGHWLRLYAPASDRTYYLAHLAGRAHVDDDEEVAAGTVVGLVGRSGNARTTCPHLHLRASLGADRLVGGEWKRTGPAVNLFAELRRVDPSRGGATDPSTACPPLHPRSPR